MRNFYEKLERKNLLAIFEEDGSTIQSNLTLKEESNPDNQDNHDHHGESGAEEHDIDPHYLLLDKETERQMQIEKTINQQISKFYMPKVEQEQFVMQGYDTDDLVVLSDDEVQEDTSYAV